MLFSIFLVCLSYCVGYKIGTYTKVQSEFYQQNEAELRVREELNKLDKSKYYVMHDITLPTSEGTTQIDHVVFGQNGIFVIETKGHKGWIFGGERDKNWTQSLPGGKKFKFYNPLIQNDNHIKNLVRVSNTPLWAMRSIIVLANAEVELKTPLPDHVIKIHDLIPYIERWNLNTLDRRQLHETIGCVEFNRKERSLETTRNHIDYVNNRFN